MVHRCPEFPGTEALKIFLRDEEEEEEDEIQFNQLTTTDRAELVNKTLSLGEFIDLLATKLDELTS